MVKFATSHRWIRNLNILQAISSVWDKKTSQLKGLRVLLGKISLLAVSDPAQQHQINNTIQ